MDSSVRKVDKSLETLSTTSAKITPIADGVSKGIGSVGRSAGMAGIQVQQFVGQIQGGQSAMVALSQQGADLGFVLGAPLLGAVVGITASVVGMALAFGDVKVEMKDTSEVTKALVKDFDKLDAETQKIVRSLLVIEINKQEKALKALQEEGRTTIGFWDVALNSTEENAEETASYTANILDQELALKKLKKQLSELGGSSDAFIDTISAEQSAISELIVSTVHLGNTYGFSAKEVALYQAGLLGANEAQTDAINLAFERVESLEAEAQSLKDVSAIEDRFKSEELLLQEKLERELEIVGENNELKLELEAEFQENLLEIELKAEARKQKALDDDKKRRDKLQKDKDKQGKLDDKIAKQDAKRDEQFASDAMALASFVFEDNKSVSAGIALVNTATGVTKALASQDYAGAALTAVIGAAQIASILGASKGGGSVSSVSSAPPQQAQQSFEQDTTSLDFTDASESGSTTQTINFGTDSGDDLIEAIATALNKAQSEGRA